MWWLLGVWLTVLVIGLGDRACQYWWGRLFEGVPDGPTEMPKE